MKKIFLIAIVIGMCVGLANAQDTYNLEFKMDGLADTTIYLGYYYGESTYIKDTARVDTEGSFQFSKRKELKPGVYFLVLNRSNILNFMIGKDATLRMETAIKDPIRNITYNSSKDNQLFYAFALYNNNKIKEAEPYLKVLKDSTATESEINAAQAKYQAIEEETKVYRDKVIAENPNSYTGKMLLAQTNPSDWLEPSRMDEEGYAVEFLRTHYFDGIDLTDDFFIRLPQPVYKNRVNFYFDKLTSPASDSVIATMDRLIEKAKSNPETYKYMVWTLLLEYQNPKFMGQDDVFVHLYGKYFASGEMDFWANAQLIQNIGAHANQLKKSLIGAQAKELRMQDQNLEPKSLLEIKNKYTVLYFYDPDCGHCKIETPKLKRFKENTSFDVQVYAVSADTSIVKMKTYISEMQLEDWVNVNGPRSYVGKYQDLYDAERTPTLYVINEQKKIIAKKIEADMLEDFLLKYEALQGTE